MKKRFLSMVLSVMMVFSVIAGTSASAASADHTGQADKLYQMGLFKGTGTNPDGTPIYSLDAAATRIQGLIMLIRLLGEEEEALAFEGACPFTDVPAWAERYAAYAYAKGYTKGTSATTFSDGPLYSNALLTFVLRALGYSDSAGDFTYNTAFVMAAEIGLISPGEFTNQSAVLLRSSCVQISYNALLTKVKGSDQTLIKTLVANGAVDQAKAEASGIFRSQRYAPFFGKDYVALQTAALNRYGSAPLANAKYYGLEGIEWIDHPKTEADYINNIKYSCLVGNYNLNFTFETDEESSAFIEFADNDYMGGNLNEIYKSFPELMGSHVNGDLELLMGSSFYWFGIRNAALSNAEIYQQQQEALAKALEISKSLHDSGKITDTMSQKEIVQVYYDYMRSYGVKPYNGFFDMVNKGTLGDHMKYDTAYSALIQKEAACSGRAAAFALLMHIEGIPCATLGCHVKGAPKDDGHGITYLAIDGEEYVVDFGNKKPLQTLKAARSFLDEIDQYSLELVRAATAR